MPPVNRPEHVGSFLRPPAVHSARADFAAGRIDAAALRQVEDASIRELVKSQQKAGLKGISDGEYRREYFHLDFLKHLGGITVSKNKLVAADKAEALPPQLTVTGKLEHKAPIQLKDYEFVKGLLGPGEEVKVAIPSPTMAHFRGGRAAIDIQSYPSMDLFFADLATVYRAEIKTLTDAGCTYIQLDDTNLAYLCDPAMRAAAKERGEDLDELPRQYAALINDALRDVPEGVQKGLHLCRGNFRSRHFAEGGYEAVAKVLLQDINVDVFLLEFDDSRSGDFTPLRFLPQGKSVVLGLVSTKLAAMEDKAALIARIHEAAKYAPLEQLSVGPQCGFASTVHGNEITEKVQWAKIRLCAEVAKDVWG